ncbi:DUF2188 domain-containing protein [Jiella pacifica]|uniref:DUF2188 domain-containing protein n=1 Tax=Jiella pacifica TaxID=2696469 RepID=A0A6N9T3K8_9HYPH|nr:DUF2188 domain-containing protein [Jiella pacifica]NDW05963.1 DUF2188 domain-containing protein [Jiella pacifica]
MAQITYHIVEHDGGFAYKLGDVYSETFATHDAAFLAARQAAVRQQQPGETAGIVWEDAGGKWHAEVSSGGDRPRTAVEDDT